MSANVVILGCGRSGTSIFGELFQHLDGYRYHFEPSFEELRAIDFAEGPVAVKVPKAAPGEAMTPGLPFVLEDLLALIPEPRVIFWQLRHPLDAICSLRPGIAADWAHNPRPPEWEALTEQPLVARCARHWQYINEDGFAAVRYLARPMRYEDLVRNPRAFALRVCAMTRHDPTNSLPGLEQWARRVGNRKSPDSYEAQRQVRWSQQDHARRVGRWRENLSASEYAMVLPIVEATAHLHGYELDAYGSDGPAFDGLDPDAPALQAPDLESRQHLPVPASAAPDSPAPDSPAADLLASDLPVPDLPVPALPGHQPNGSELQAVAAPPVEAADAPEPEAATVLSSMQRMRRLFEEEFCNLNTAQFLRHPEARVVTQLCAERKQEELSALRRFLERPVRRVSPDFRIAISNYALETFAGSELWTRDFAGQSRRTGHPVIVHSPKIGPVAHTIEATTITDSNDAVVNFRPDVFQVNHYNSVLPLIAKLRERFVPIVNMCLGLLPRPGLPGYDADYYLAASIVSKSKIHLLAETAWERIPVIPNFFDERFFKPRDEGATKKALLFSSRATNEQYELLRRTVSAFGFELDRAGYPEHVIEQPQDILPRYDLVFAVGRSAIEAMACGCRVILWDQGVIGPALTSDNIWDGVLANFALASGTLPVRFLEEDGASGWVAAQIERIAADDTQDVSGLVRRHLTLTNIATRLRQILADPAIHLETLRQADKMDVSA